MRKFLKKHVWPFNEINRLEVELSDAQYEADEAKSELKNATRDMSVLTRMQADSLGFDYKTASQKHNPYVGKLQPIEVFYSHDIRPSFMNDPMTASTLMKLEYLQPAVRIRDVSELTHMNFHSKLVKDEFTASLSDHISNDLMREMGLIVSKNILTKLDGI